MELDYPHILVVDDEESTREVLQRALEKRGYQTTVAPSVAEAGELLERQAFHLMVLDNRMPGKSGLDYLPEVVAKYP